MSDEKYFIMETHILDWGRHDEADDFPWFRYDNKILLKLGKEQRNIDVVKDLGYNSTLSLDDSADIDFVVGNTITSNFRGGVSLSANIVSYNDSDNQMVISHLQNSDGNFRLPAIDDKIKSTDANGNILTRKIRVVNESLAQPTAQN